MNCLHTETFECGNTLRCSSCYLDSYLLHDGTRFWPAQEHPSAWDDQRVADWFLDNKIYHLSQGCEGFTFCRTPSPGATYGYAWVMNVLDLDYEMCWMLDVRREDGLDESRQFVFIGSGLGRVMVGTHTITTKIMTTSHKERERLNSGLHWFADQVDAWIQAEGSK